MDARQHRGGLVEAAGNIEKPDDRDERDVFRRHHGALDGLRGLAVLAVMLFHFQLSAPTGSPSLPLIDNGWFGVDIFFVLSGFLITRTLREQRSGDRYWRTFLIRRALRILPPFALYLLVLSPVLVAYQADVPLWTYLLFVTNFWLSHVEVPIAITITWSLAIEEQFYLAWPSLVRRLTRSRLVLGCVVLIVAAPIFRLLLHAPDNLVSYAWTMCRMDALAWGALAWLVYESGWQQVQRMAARVAPVAVVACCALLGFGGRLRPQLWFAVGGYTAISIAAAATVLAVTTGFGPRLRSLLNVSALRHLGRVSYPAYLFHPITAAVFALPLVEELVGTNIGLVLALPTALTWAVSTLIHRTIEQPSMALKRRLTGGMASGPFATTVGSS